MEPPFLSLDEVEQFVPLAAARGVSEVARGRGGFLEAYRRAAGDPSELSDAWRHKRAAFIARHEAQAQRAGEPMFEDDGTPTRRHLALMMWAYSPAVDETRDNCPGPFDELAVASVLRQNPEQTSWSLSDGVPSPDDLFAASQTFADTPRGRGLVPLSVEDMATFGNVVMSALASLPRGVDVDGLSVIVTPSDTRPEDERWEEAGVTPEQYAAELARQGYDVPDPMPAPTGLDSNAPLMAIVLDNGVMHLTSTDNKIAEGAQSYDVVDVQYHLRGRDKGTSLLDDLMAAGWHWTPRDKHRVYPPSDVYGRLRSNPDGALPADALPAEVAAEEIKATPAARGSVVKKLDAGMDVWVEKAVAGGDNDAITAIWERYYPYARKLAYKVMAQNLPISPQTGRPKRPSADAADEVATIAMNRLLYGSSRADERGGTAEGTPAIRRFRIGGQASFATYIGGIVKHVASERWRQYKSEQKAAQKAAEEAALAQMAPSDDVPEDVLDPEQLFSKRQAEKELRALAVEQGQALELGFGQLDDDEKQVLQLRGRGLTYAQIADELYPDIERKKAVQRVMVRLHRARKHLEQASGQPLRGLVGTLGDAFGMRKQGRPRKNPEEEILFVETLDDLCDLCDVGIIDGPCYRRCLEECLARGF